MTHNIIPVLPVLFRIFILLLPMVNYSQELPGLKNLKGSWMGVLNAGTLELRLVMNISFTASDSALVTFDSPDQGVNDIPTSKVVFTGDSLLVESNLLQGKFSGSLMGGLDTIRGIWTQRTISLPLTFNKTDKKTVLNRPQEPRPPFPYKEEAVFFPNLFAGIELSGTLTLPEGDGPFPAVVLVTGSGPQNKDEELMGHKPFFVLSDYLTRLGFAVLRYDDRGTGKSKGVFETATTFDFAGDAEAALEFLKKHPAIDTSKIGIIGHSEGGVIASIIASRRANVGFIVLMAAPGLPGEQILLLQSALIRKSQGADDQTIEKENKLAETLYTILKKNPDNQKAEKLIREQFARFDKKYADDTHYHPLSEEALTGQIHVLTTPWFRCFLTLDPEVYLSKVSCNVLAMIGSLDLQVPMSENLKAIESALIVGGNPNYEMVELPGLNHLFQKAQTGNPAEYAKIEETISPQALEVIGNWMKKR